MITVFVAHSDYPFTDFVPKITRAQTNLIVQKVVHVRDVRVLYANHGRPRKESPMGD